MILCGFDLETPQDEPSWGLQPWRAKTDGATIKSVGVYSEDLKLKGAVRMPSVKTFADLLGRCHDNKYVITGWNVMFDISWLMAIGLEQEVKANRWLDAMLLLKRIDAWRAKEYGGVGFGLKPAVAERWPQYADYGLDDDTIVKVPQTPEEWDELLRYQFRDAKFTTMLAREYLSRLSEEERKSAYIEASTIPDVALAYIEGIHINREALNPFKTDVENRLMVAEELAGVDVSVVRSPKKLRELLYEDWGYDPVKKTPKGDPATDKESLLKLAIQYPEDERFKGLMDLRKCNTQQTKFVGGVIKSTEYHGENVVRPMPVLSGTYSGRFTYASTQGTGKKKCQTGIALHQWERGKPVRDLLTAPPGYLLAEFDFSGQEMRLMAMESGDEVMLDLFATGGDGHAYMGASIENLDYEWLRANSDTDARAKEARNLGKFANLSLQYRIGVDTIMVRALTQYGLQLWRAKAQHIKDTYLRTYKRVPQYWDWAIKQAAKAGYAETRGHRRIPLYNLNLWDQQQTAINYRIQGTGGDMKTLGIAVCKPYFNGDMLYGWDLHDALFTYVKDDAKALGRVLALKKLLSNLPYKRAWGWTPEIPLPVDAKMGKTWGTLKGV